MARLLAVPADAGSTMSVNEILSHPASVPLSAAAFWPLDVAPEFIEILPVAIYACDAAGRVLWFNRRAAELWGRSPRIGDDAELFCGSHKVIFGGREIGRAETPMAVALRTGCPVDGAEGIVERPDGSRIWAKVYIDLVRDETGAIAGAVNCFLDSTDHHRANEDLRSKQQDLEDFFENGAVALHLVGSDGRILRANKAELELLGYTAEEYVGRPVADFHVDTDVIRDILVRLGRGEKLDKYPARLRAKDGSIKHVLITSSAQFKDGQFQHTRCFTLDVTESRLAQERLAENERWFRQVLEALPAAVYTTDAEGRITYYNQAAVELSGREPELGTDHWCVTWQLYWPDGTPLPHDQCPMAIALKEGRPIRNAEAVAERPDGTKVPFIPYPTPLRDSSGALVGAVNMLVDVSERKQAETQQRVLLDELNHRVKNNMQMLHSLLWNAQREAEDPKSQAILAEAGHRVAAMAAAQRVLYDARNPTCFDAKDFLEAVCGAARQALSKEVTIRCETARGQLSNETAMPLALILNELLTNAAKHGGPGIVRVGLVCDSGSSNLTVEDDGPGFDLKEVRKRSSGLGLVMGLARQLGGRLEVQRTPGARCIVRF
jgi:PAS domain S-box-containing protein